MPWSTGTECVAKYNFQTANEQDLPFCKGDVLTIVGVTRVRSEPRPWTRRDQPLTSSQLEPFLTAAVERRSLADR